MSKKHPTREKLIKELAHVYLREAKKRLKQAIKDGELDSDEFTADTLNDQAAHMFYEDRCFQLDVEDMMETLSHKYVK